MTPKERILATIERKNIDRFPVDVWLTPEVLHDLKQTTGCYDELELYARLGLDKIVFVFPGYGEAHFDPNASNGITPWGVTTRRVSAGKASYDEFGTPPLGEFEEIEQLHDYPLWPDPQNFSYAECKSLALRARSHNFATIGPWISHFEIYCQMRGLENALMDVVAEPEFLEAALDKIESIQTDVLNRFLQTLGSDLDIVFISDDMGTQGSLLISLEAWKTHLQPRLKRWCDLIHAHGKKVLFHTDGAVLPLIPHLIASGIDILNPIQHICPGMDLQNLKVQFGQQVVFHGGVENQSILPFGTPGDVSNETRACLETLGADGQGYIVSSCHNIQAGTPVANVMAMIETVHQHKL